MLPDEVCCALSRCCIEDRQSGLMSMGMSGSLSEALQAATAQLARWLGRDYKLTATEQVLPGRGDLPGQSCGAPPARHEHAVRSHQGEGLHGDRSVVGTVETIGLGGTLATAALGGSRAQ
jgi:hypothetical protein